MPPTICAAMYDGGNARRQFAAQCHCDADGRIEVRARHRAERQNQHRKNGPGRDCVAKKRERAVTARELRGHDAAADDARE